MIRVINYRAVIRLVYVLCFLQMSGCVIHKSSERWPDEIPAKSLFVDAFIEQQANNTNSDNLNNHLAWIKRFYQGSFIYSLGWNRMTEILIDTIQNAEQHANIKKRMYDLGLTICIEWAQDNSSRKIDSKAIAVWGNALRTASELNQQSYFVKQVENDVVMLLNGSLNKKQIFRERYYPTEDYDNF